MKVNTAEILELTTDNDYELRDKHAGANLDVVFEGNMATLSRDGKKIAQLQTYDDSPVVIDPDGIVISGVLINPQPKTENGFGKWLLK